MHGSSYFGKTYFGNSYFGNQLVVALPDSAWMHSPIPLDEVAHMRVSLDQTFAVALLLDESDLFNESMSESLHLICALEESIVWVKALRL